MTQHKVWSVFKVFLLLLTRLKMHFCSFVSFSRSLQTNSSSSTLWCVSETIKCFYDPAAQTCCNISPPCCRIVAVTLPVVVVVVEISGFQDSLSAPDFVLEQTNCGGVQIQTWSEASSKHISAPNHKKRPRFSARRANARASPELRRVTGLF